MTCKYWHGLTQDEHLWYVFLKIPLAWAKVAQVCWLAGANNQLRVCVVVAGEVCA